MWSATGYFADHLRPQCRLRYCLVSCHSKEHPRILGIFVFMTELRATRHDDISELGQLLDGVFRRSKGITDQSQLTDFPLVFSPANYSNSRVIVEDARIVSHAALWPRELIVGELRLKAAVIVSVATLPDYRMRGHAATLMRDLQDTLSADGFDLAILWTSVPDFYRKLGWEITNPRGVIATVDAGSLSISGEQSYEVEQFDPARHLDDVIAIHDQECVRFARDRDVALQLLTLPKIRVWVAIQNGSVAAYLAHATACNKRGLIEYGGDPDGVIELVGHVAASADAALEWMLFHSSPDLIRWAERIGLSCRPLKSSKGFGVEMIRPVRPENVSQRVRDELFVWGLDWA